MMSDFLLKLRNLIGRESIEPFARSAHDVLERGDDDLSRLFYEPTDKALRKWGHYLPIYERYFSPLRRCVSDGGAGVRAPRILEIGVHRGGSLGLWRRYFGSGAVIFGIDIDPACRVYDGADGSVRVGSQADPVFLREVVEEMGRPDIIIDDGSHVAKHQMASFKTLFPLLNEGGLYVVEDLHTAYWRSFGGGLRRRGTFIEQVKALIDDMHVWYSPRAKLYADPEMSVCGIHIFDSIVVLEKGRRVRPFHVEIGGSAAKEQPHLSTP